MNAQLAAALEERDRMRALVQRLRDGMRTWAWAEDGEVHPGAWDAYADACEALGERRPCTECGRPLSEPNSKCLVTAHFIPELAIAQVGSDAG